MVDYFSLRVNPDLKQDFYSFCKRKGFTAGKAVKLLARQFSSSGVLSFPLDNNQTYTEGNDARVSIHMDAETRQKFSDTCSMYGVPMSIVVRAFMEYCVHNDSFPFDMGLKNK